MNKENLDRIVVSSNEKMGKIIMWYLDNQSWIDKMEFHPPMDTGLIILEEEGIEVTFESKPPVVELAVYPNFGNIPAMTYDYDPRTKKYSNYRFPAHLSKERLQILRAVSKVDRTDYKEAIKYHSLMMFAAHYEKIIEVDESQTKRRTKHEAKKLRKRADQPIPLFRKTYVVKEIDEKELMQYGEKHHYTKPDKEVQVRGFFRTSKTGKVSWVRPFSRYKEKGNRISKEYRV